MADVNLTLTIKDVTAGNIDRITNAFDSQFPGRLDEDPVPTQKEWIKSKLLKYVIEIVRRSEYIAAQKTANDSVAAQPEPEIE